MLPTNRLICSLKEDWPVVARLFVYVSVRL
jgi:hypothetical protein